MRILIIEDEPALAEALARGLRRLGLVVDIGADGAQGLRKAAVVAYDAIVLDRDLPLVHGDEVCRRLAADGHPARVLMLTAAGELDDLVGGLDPGADDYCVKPVRLAELAARLRALGRRGVSMTPAVLRTSAASAGRSIRH